MKTSALHICLACLAWAYASQALSLETLDGLEVAMPGDSDQAAEGVHLFGVSVKHGDKTWTARHRYNDFKTLKEKLGPDADSLPDAPFPGKFWWPFPSESRLASRREGLETWLLQVLEHPNCKDSWKEPLGDFLDEDSEIETTQSWSQKAQKANANVIQGWETTTDKFKKWYKDGLEHCKGDQKCAQAKERFDGMVATTKDKMKELKQMISSQTVLSSDVSKAKEDLDNLKASDAAVEAVDAAEKKYKEKEQEAIRGAEEIQELEEDMNELDEAAKATMENSLESTLTNAEL
jgi:hypothetical protein